MLKLDTRLSYIIIVHLDKLSININLFFPRFLSLNVQNIHKDRFAGAAWRVADGMSIQHSELLSALPVIKSDIYYLLCNANGVSQFLHFNCCSQSGGHGKMYVEIAKIDVLCTRKHVYNRILWSIAGGYSTIA